MTTIWHIAKNVFRETLRDRILSVVALFAVLLLAASGAVGWISPEDGPRTAVHFSLAIQSLFGALMATFVGAGLIRRETERGTIQAVLAKPIARWRFLLGEYLGLVTALGLAMAGMVAAAVGLVYWAVASAPVDPWSPAVRWDWYAMAAVMPLVEMAVIVAVALFFGVVTGPVLSALFTFVIYLAGQVSGGLADAAARNGSSMAAVMQFLAYALPDLRHFQIRNQAVLGPAPTWSQVLWGAGYGAAYAAAMLILATLAFSRKRL